MREALDGIEVFVETVEAGNFARAADRLALTRSAVGKAVSRLEDRLGVRLFHRTTRTQSLTEDGQIYYERCVRALEELQSGAALIDSGRREVVGRLRVSMPILFGRYCVQPVLLDLAERHPHLELDLAFGDAVVDVVADGFDLAIRNGTRGDRAGLHSRRIATQRKLLCAAPSYLAGRTPLRGIEDLAAHEALVYWRNGQLFPWALTDAGGSPVDVPLRWRLQFDSQEAIADAAVRGMGIAWLPGWLVREDLAAGRLVTVLDDHAGAPLETYAIWPSTPHMPMRLRVAIDALATGVQTMVEL